MKKILRRQKYQLFGKNSSAKLCHWTKKSIYGEGVCYKQRFYGIQSHRCIQMTPSTTFCTHNCVFCWRAGDFREMEVRDPDDPDFIVDESITAQRKLISGFGGVPGRIDRKRYEEAWHPKHAAISLSGEPFSYPLMDDLIKSYHRKGFTTFVVTNGTFPDRIGSLKNLPTQLYLSLCAPDEVTYIRTQVPLIEDGWERIGRSLELMSRLRCRRVIRMTMVKGLNMFNPEGYADLIRLASPDYVEVKAYMHRGSSIYRLKKENMPTHKEIVAFANELAGYLDYIFTDDSPPSRVALLSRDERALASKVISYGFKTTIPKE